MSDPRAGRPSLRPRASNPAPAGLDTVLATARGALTPLRATTPLDRGRGLVAVAADLEDRRAQLVDEVRRSGGGRFSEAVTTVDGLVDDTVRWAGWADKLDLLVPGWPWVSRSPSVVLVLPGALRDVTATVTAALLAGGTCLVADGSRPVALVVAALLAQFPAGSVQPVPDTAAALPVRVVEPVPATDAERLAVVVERVSVTV